MDEYSALPASADVNRYLVSGLMLESAMSLPELTSFVPVDFSRGVEPNNRCVFHLRSAVSSFLPRDDWFHHWPLTNSQQIWLSLARSESTFTLRFPEMAEFTVSHTGDDIVCVPASSTPLTTLCHLLIDQVVPLVLNLRGRESLHASAVVTPFGACAFMGPSGQGKSTLAGAFLDDGALPLCDDCLTLEAREEVIWALPSYAGVRLWSDTTTALFQEATLSDVAHYTEKQRVQFETSARQEIIPLKAIYLPEKSDDNASNRIVIEPLSAAEAFNELLLGVFRLDIADREMLVRQFRFLQEVALRVPLRRLTYVRDFDLLPQVRSTILDDLKTL